ncbi:hypothetical protein DCAR_0104729 [Daucus carota subsp. sativus]|uniref:Uncharacterized protein n=1 Tax=Daucus carota subsp. sativus TaxID=79200 RepID=A0A166J2I1_DAUCS|nr:PREDICTED: ectonucleotide pyrophosphatase/phosphodiesterase family member 3-like [Daucus carota subsp. sativus]WOG85538.1 hypothetical protein DCAR_0104729 [Daucus carota subsp. sativus]
MISDSISLTHPPLLPTQHNPPKPISKHIATAAAISLSLLTLSALFISLSPSSTPHSPTHQSKLQETQSGTKLAHPVVILISSDGFRFGYQHKTPTPNIKRLIANGTEAEPGLIPVYPTLTFPNHYSIVTGLYPAYHGIVNNYFVDPDDGDVFSMSSHEPKWWLGEPLWETVVNQGLKAATYFWPGSEVHKGSWTCPSGFCAPYNESVAFDERVDTILSYFDLPKEEVPVFMTLYFEDPDHQGHQVGPDDPLISEAVGNIDRLIGRLISGLEERGVFEDVTIIMVGDHGMVGTCDQKLIFLDELAPWIDIPEDWIQYTSPLLAIRPQGNVFPADIVAKINEGLKSGKVGNGEYLKVYLKEDLPSRLHYWESDRITPIIGLVDEGYKVELTKSEDKECGGAHGYDNAFFSMRTIFIGHGPRFPKGVKIPSFENIQIYNLVTSILNIKGASNNGTSSFANTVLLPHHH